ncbi:signal peptide peptidase SppA [Amorphus orientalis]|uniref:Signal peptide peptidase SppA n=1 Tax=Amorphus orientalis TaxID=649198 RepID=A0AAE4AT01_9HYPH|nr:signal peptide peptidase SppA [Amorphus orientalis]
MVPIVRVSGAIGLSTPLRPGVTMASLAHVLERAFSIKRAPAVAILINSPGGSPVQSHLIYKRIRALAEEKEKRVLVFVEDVCASGGYMIAAAGDEIYVDQSSIVGSIGVVSQGFGFVGLIDKLGIERRVYTSGDRKAILDPFKPEREEDIAHLLNLQEEVHAEFRDLVKARRGDLLSDDDDVFSGLFWTGRTAVSLGLADGIGDARTLIRERYGDETILKVVSAPRSMPFRRPPPGVSFPDTSGLGRDIVSTLEERALWARYGL